MENVDVFFAGWAVGTIVTLVLTFFIAFLADI